MHAARNKLNLCNAAGLQVRLLTRLQHARAVAYGFLRSCGQAAVSGKGGVDPPEPAGQLVPEPQEPGPEDCCQVDTLAPLTETRKSLAHLWSIFVLFVQSGCTFCVWDSYRDTLLEYQVQQARLKGNSPPVKALDPFEEMERTMSDLAEGKGPKAPETSATRT